jgi:hypothetical protein
VLDACCGASFADQAEDEGDDGAGEAACAAFEGATPRGTCMDGAPPSGVKGGAGNGAVVTFASCADHKSASAACNMEPADGQGPPEPYEGTESCCHCGYDGFTTPECTEQEEQEILAGCLADSTCTTPASCAGCPELAWCSGSLECAAWSGPGGAAACYFKDAQVLCTFEQVTGHCRRACLLSGCLCTHLH